MPTLEFLTHPDLVPVDVDRYFPVIVEAKTAEGQRQFLVFRIQRQEHVGRALVALAFPASDPDPFFSGVEIQFRLGAETRRDSPASQLIHPGTAAKIILRIESKNKRGR